MGHSYDLLVVGDYCLDLVFTGLPGLPVLGQEIVSSGFDQIPGGAFTTAVAAHRLDLRVGWASDFGNDPYSLFVLAQVRKEGLAEDLFVMHHRSLRNITVSLSYEQERAFVAFYDPPPSLPAAIHAIASADARALVVPGIYTGRLLDAGLFFVHARRMKLVMDGNSNEQFKLKDPAVRRAISSADLFMPNAAEALRLTGENDLECAARALGRLCALVVIKNGRYGALAVAGEQMIKAPGIPVKAIDTTGAGDCFNAGFLRAWLDDRPLEECLRWGNIVGGLSTLARGGTGHVTGAKEVHEWLEKTPKN
ncbi:MAG TPA: carbohydrate kinase family protein [Anaerolineaceae bacterium]|nr:carbohydrate kinase family protein [Anaerolineaceae bacterium]